MNSFGLDINSHIITINTDGCNLMTTLDRVFPGPQLLCMAHMLNLCVTKSIYAKNVTSISKNKIKNYENQTQTYYTDNEQLYTEDYSSYSEEYLETKDESGDKQFGNNNSEQNKEFQQLEMYDLVNKVRKTVSKAKC